MKNKLTQLIVSLNNEANTEWRDDRHIELYSCKEDGNNILIDFSIGKWEKAYYTVSVGYDGWKVLDRAGRNANLEDFMSLVMMNLYNLVNEQI